MYIGLMGASGLKRGHTGRHPQRELHGQPPEGPLPHCLHGRQAAAWRTSSSSTCASSRRRPRSSRTMSPSDLMDFGFHAPTMSFPVVGTLMIEPTESESKAELDRLCDALIVIRAEICEIEQGRMDRENNPLRNAPHTAAAVSRDRMEPPLPARAGGLPLRVGSAAQVLAAGRPHRQRLGRPQPVLHVRSG